MSHRFYHMVLMNGKQKKRGHPGGSAPSTPERIVKKGKRKIKNKPNHSDMDSVSHTGDSSPPTPTIDVAASSQQPSTSNAPQRLHSPFFTENPFAALPTEENEAMDTTQTTVKRPPPIFVKQVVNFKTLCDQLSSIIGRENFSCVNKLHETKILTTTPDAYRETVRYLERSGAPHHTYQLPQERSFRVAIRHLHPSTPIEDITTELTELGYVVRHVHNVKSSRLSEGQTEKIPLPVFFVDLEPGEINKEIYKLKTLCYTKIKVESPHKRNIVTQCTKCQGFGHTRSFCGYPPKCVKCSGPHESRDCTKPRTEPATCVHCKKDHPANYRGCATFRSLQSRIHPERGAAAAGTQHQATERQGRPPRRVSLSRSRPTSQQRGQPRPVQPTSQDIPSSFQLQDYPVLPETAAIPGFTPPAVNKDTPQPKATASRRPSMSYVPQPSSSSHTGDFTSVLATFMTEFRALIVPLINLLTVTLSQLLNKNK